MSLLEFPHVTAIHDGDWVVVQLSGEFDLAMTDLLRTTFVEAISSDCHRVVVDLSPTRFLDSTALGALVGAARNAARWGGWLRLVAPPPNVRKVLRITELDRVFGLYDTVEQALSHGAAPEPV